MFTGCDLRTKNGKTWRIYTSVCQPVFLSWQQKPMTIIKFPRLLKASLTDHCDVKFLFISEDLKNVPYVKVFFQDNFQGMWLHVGSSCECQTWYLYHNCQGGLCQPSWCGDWKHRMDVDVAAVTVKYFKESFASWCETTQWMWMSLQWLLIISRRMTVLTGEN